MLDVGLAESRAGGHGVMLSGLTWGTLPFDRRRLNEAAIEARLLRIIGEVYGRLRPYPRR